MRTCRCGEEFLIDGPKDRYKTCPDCRGESGSGSLAERSKTRRIKEGAELQYDDDVEDVRDRDDPDLTPDNPFGYSATIDDED